MGSLLTETRSPRRSGAAEAGAVLAGPPPSVTVGRATPVVRRAARVGAGRPRRAATRPAASTAAEARALIDRFSPRAIRGPTCPVRDPPRLLRGELPRRRRPALLRVIDNEWFVSGPGRLRRRAHPEPLADDRRRARRLRRRLPAHAAADRRTRRSGALAADLFGARVEDDAGSRRPARPILERVLGAGPRRATAVKRFAFFCAQSVSHLRTLLPLADGAGPRRSRGAPVHRGRRCATRSCSRGRGFHDLYRGRARSTRWMPTLGADPVPVRRPRRGATAKRSPSGREPCGPTSSSTSCSPPSASSSPAPSAVPAVSVVPHHAPVPARVLADLRAHPPHRDHARSARRRWLGCGMCTVSSTPTR